jgi:ribosome-binding factor A
VIPEEKFEEILESLNKKIYFLQQKFNRLARMRPLPRLKILAEKKTGEAAKVEEILEQLKKVEE